MTTKENPDSGPAQESSAGRQRNPVVKWWRELTATTKCVIVVLPIVVGIVMGILGFILGRVFEVPGPTEIWRIATQPLATITTGLAALFAGLLAYTSGKQTRDQEKDHHGSDRCWLRLQWVIDKSSNETSGDTGLSPILRRAILKEIEMESKTLDDLSLRTAVATYSLLVGEAFADTSLIE